MRKERVPPHYSSLGGEYTGRLRNDVWYSSVLSAIEDSAQVSPRALGLTCVYPNPTRTGAEIRYTLARSACVRVAVYGCSGDEIRTLTTGPKEVGTHSAYWSGVDNSGRDVAPGIHFVRLEGNGPVEEKKIVRLR